MWVYLGSSCPDHPSPEELSAGGMRWKPESAKSWILQSFCRPVSALTPCEEGSQASGSVP
jgi:hypothetical protein